VKRQRKKNEEAEEDKENEIWKKNAYNQE